MIKTYPNFDFSRIFALPFKRSASIEGDVHVLINNP